MPERFDPRRIQELRLLGREPSTFRLSALALTVGNLAVCAIFDHLVRNVGQAHYVFLFFFCELGALALFSAGSFLTREREIVTKTRVLPVASAERFLAVTLRLALRWPVFALVLTSSVFVFILTADSFTRAAMAIGCYWIGAALTVAFTSLVCLAAMRSSQAVLVLIVVAVVASLGVLLASMIFEPTRLVPYVPVSSWVARGVLAARSGGTAQAALWAGALGAALVAVAVAGLKGRRW